MVGVSKLSSVLVVVNKVLLEHSDPHHLQIIWLLLLALQCQSRVIAIGMARHTNLNYLLSGPLRKGLLSLVYTMKLSLFTVNIITDVFGFSSTDLQCAFPLFPVVLFFLPFLFLFEFVIFPYSVFCTPLVNCYVYPFPDNSRMLDRIVKTSLLPLPPYMLLFKFSLDLKLRRHYYYCL